MVQENDNKEMMQQMAELKKLIEKNSALQVVAESEPKNVLAKTYIEGTPQSLKNLIATLIGSYSIDSKGNTLLDKKLAVTLMIEDISSKK